jgi:glycosyltransferase involved in cell wall biosynthesis
MISVVICTNRPGQVSNAVRSVLANAEPPFELVVVAQGGEWAAGDLEVFRGDARLRIVNDPGRGLSRARNVALSASTGSLVLFTDDDCFVLPRLRTQSVFEERPDVALVFGAVEAPPRSSRVTAPCPPSVIAARGSARSRGTSCASDQHGRTALGVDRVGLFDDNSVRARWRARRPRLRAASWPRGSASRDDGRAWCTGAYAGWLNDRELWRRDGVGIGAAREIVCGRKTGGGIRRGFVTSSAVKR